MFLAFSGERRKFTNSSRRPTYSQAVHPRRSFAKWSLLAALICLLSLNGISKAQEEQQTAEESDREARPKPNVLLIMVDDLNDWIGCMRGHPGTQTPNIDALSREGVLFMNAHCQGPICGPSRASMLSGLFPHTTGVYQQPTKDNLGKDEEHFRGKLLPEYFAQNGYETLGVGKITHGYPEDVAFQKYGGWKDGFGPKPEGGKRFNYELPSSPYSGTQTDWGAFPERDEQMPDFRSASWAIEQLESDHDKPFFLAVGMVRPHVPFYVPEKWFEQFPLESVVLPKFYREDQNDIPELGIRIHELPKYPDLAFLQANNDEQYRKCVQAYLACINFVDFQIGRVLQSLMASDYADNTVIVLCSDHGYHIGEKDRVSKHSLWEESTHVPLIISLPVHRNDPREIIRRNQLPVGLIDIYPTLLELCGLPANPSNEGESLVPLLFQPQVDGWREAILTTYAKGNHALRTETHRLIRYEDGRFELYDHTSDPEEWNNLAGPAQTSRAAMEVNFELAQHLSQYFPKTEADYHPSTSRSAINAWFEEHLKANGVIPSDTPEE
ncbi:sulfatase [Thalassoglobus sp. JC818]|uniref:sulfatase n=1 Tax=Thalassoglobus sp. JC818 TaxID=3232136 RepID=UPI00345A8EB3